MSAWGVPDYSPVCQEITMCLSGTEGEGSDPLVFPIPFILESGFPGTSAQSHWPCNLHHRLREYRTGVKMD